MSSTDLQSKLAELQARLASAQQTAADSAAKRLAMQPQIDQRQADMQSILDNLKKINLITQPVITTPSLPPPVVTPIVKPE